MDWQLFREYLQKNDFQYLQNYEQNKRLREIKKINGFKLYLWERVTNLKINPKEMTEDHAQELIQVWKKLEDNIQKQFEMNADYWNLIYLDEKNMIKDREFLRYMDNNTIPHNLDEFQEMFKDIEQYNLRIKKQTLLRVKEKNLLNKLEKLINLLDINQKFNKKQTIGSSSGPQKNLGKKFFKQQNKQAEMNSINNISQDSIEKQQDNMPQNIKNPDIQQQKKQGYFKEGYFKEGQVIVFVIGD